MENEHIDSGNHESYWSPDNSIEGGLYRIILRVENSDNINCYGNVCLCLENQDCNDICGY